MSRLIESNLDETRIYRIKESEFDPSHFTNDRSDSGTQAQGIQGLFDYKDLLSYSSQTPSEGQSDVIVSRDIWDIRGNVEDPPYPFGKGGTDYPLGIMSGFICEKPSYLLKLNKIGQVDFYPLSNGPEFTKAESFMNNSLSKTSYESDTISFDDKSLNREINVTPWGASPSSSLNINKILFDTPPEEGDYGSWKYSWTPEASKGDGGLSFAYDTVKIPAGTPSLFSKTIGGLEEGTYCFSFFARLSDESNNVYERTQENLTGSIELTIKGETKSFSLSTEWQRFFKVFTLESTGDLEITLSLGNLGLPVKVCGLLLEKRPFPTPYDRRQVLYESNEDQETTEVYYPLVFKSNKISDEGPWTVIYKRFLESDPNLDYPLVDRIGTCLFGYEGGKITVNGSEIEDPEGFSIGDFIGNWETVILRYDGSKLNLKVKTSLNKEYEVKNIELTSSTFTDEEVDFNLLLGSSSLKQEGYGYYKDLTIMGFYLEDSDVESILGDFFDLGEEESFLTYRDIFPIVPNNVEEKTWEEMLEVTEGVINVTCYKLSEDSPSDFGYKEGDVLVCIKSFSSKIPEGEFGSYWSRTPMRVIKEEITDQSVFRSGSIIEGYIGE